MKILFISHKYPPTIGGMETQSYELIKEAQKNHTVLKLVHTGEESKFNFFWKLKSRIKKIIRENPGIEVIHLNDGLMGILSFFIKSYTNIPVVITLHGLDLVFPNKWYQYLIKRRIKQFDAAICVSTATAEECEIRDFPKEKIFIVANGVNHDIADFRPNPPKFKSYFKSEFGIDVENKKIITTLGRAVQRKGFSWFLENVLPELDDDTLLIMMGPIQERKIMWWERILPDFLVEQIKLAAGGLSDEGKIAELITRPEIKNKVIRTGKLPYIKMLESLSYADLFIMPNVKKWGDAEGFGLVALEACLRETVVVASKIEGITEAIQHNKNGILLPSKNKEVWINKIKELLAERDKLNPKGKEFQKFTLENYSWKKMTQGYVDVFQKVIQK